MKKYLAALVALVLMLTLPALALDGRIEKLEYKGFGVIELEFNRDMEWYPDAVFTLTDAAGAELSAAVIAGEEDDAYLYAPDMLDNAEYSLKFVLGQSEQTIPFTAATALEYRISKNGELSTKEDKEKCDFCRTAGHDEDFCPERVNPGDIPSDPDGICWYFDIDARCERCGGIGHDDDRCTNR